MALEVPIWLQAGTYPARLDRGFIAEVMRQQNRVFRGLVVAQRAAGANLSVDISAGNAAILCTTQADGGMWFVRNTTPVNVLVPAAPGAGTRTDTVIAKVRDPNAGGEAGNDFVLEVITGVVVPGNSIALATLARVAAEPSITTAKITDAAPRGEWAWTVSTAVPSGKGIPGDLWVQC